MNYSSLTYRKLENKKDDRSQSTKYKNQVLMANLKEKHLQSLDIFYHEQTQRKHNINYIETEMF